jgi:hypothetical protein
MYRTLRVAPHGSHAESPTLSGIGEGCSDPSDRASRSSVRLGAYSPDTSDGGEAAGLSRDDKIVGMRVPETWSARLPFLEALEEDWQAVPRAVLIAASAFYLLFLFEAARGRGPLLMIDLVFVPIHEGGHLLFRFFGWAFLYVAGGTLLQLGVPLMLAAYFALQRQVQGTAFCTFFFFEQFLPIATYMADARAQQLQLLTVGDSGFVIHDWHYLFHALGLLNHDVQIAHAVRALGWLGMMATVAWMAWRSWPKSIEPARSVSMDANQKFGAR